MGSVLHHRLPAHHIHNHTGFQKVRITVRVISFKRHYRRKITVTGTCIAIKEGGSPARTITGNIKINLYGKGRAPDFGDIIEFDSVIKPIRNFSNPGGFDYASYMAFKGIYATAYSNLKSLHIQPVQPGQLFLTDRVIRYLEKLRTRFHDRILSVAPPGKDSGTVFTALVTGKKETLPHEVRDTFSKAGISHLLAISGLHLSIVGTVFFLLFYRIAAGFQQLATNGAAKKIAWLAALFPVTFYAVFSGFSPATQRAYIMLLVFWCALISEKETDLLSSLCTAGIIILLLDATALFSISFQLSFSAVVFILLGIHLVAPVLLKFKSGLLRSFFGFLCVTVFAGLGTLPLTAHYFHIVSHVQLFSNILAVPVIGFGVLPLGFTAFCLFPLSQTASAALIGICLKMIDGILSMAHCLVELPFSWHRVLTFTVPEAGVFYLGGLSIFFMLKRHRKKGMACLTGTVALALLLCIGQWQESIQTRKSPLLNITVLDIGQGSSSVIQTPRKKVILVDGGGFSDYSQFDTGRMIIAPFLWYNNIRSIDTVILTHPESDHMNGLVFIFENFQVGRLIKNTDTRNSLKYKELMAVCQKKSIPVRHPSSAHPLITVDSVQLYFLGPGLTPFSTNLNDNSIVFKLIYKEFNMLFPGDILKNRESYLATTRGTDLQADLLLSPHHGSSTSSSKLFLDQVRAESVIISCGFRNRYGFPHPTVLKRYRDAGLNIFRTDLGGAAIIETDGLHHQLTLNKGG